MTPDETTPVQKTTAHLNQTVVVTGALGGIGRAVAHSAAVAGFDVIGIDRERSDAEAFPVIGADLGDPASIADAVQQLPERIHGLCNVAGVSGVAGVEATTRVNFLGVRELTLALADRFAGCGSVVNIGAFAAANWRDRLSAHLELARTTSFDEGLQWLRAHPVDDAFAYPYSKEVLRVWSQLQATTWIGTGIRVNTVNPGPVETAILDDFVKVLGQAKVGDDIKRVGRSGRPEDLGPVVGFLMRDESIWINGADLAVDGGLAGTFIADGVPARSR